MASRQQDILREFDLLEDQLQQLRDCIDSPGDHTIAVADAMSRLANTIARVRVLCRTVPVRYPVT